MIALIHSGKIVPTYYRLIKNRLIVTLFLIRAVSYRMCTGLIHLAVNPFPDNTNSKTKIVLT